VYGSGHVWVGVTTPYIVTVFNDALNGIITPYPGSTFNSPGDVIIPSQSVATSANNFNSYTGQLVASYWNGTTSANDIWVAQNVLGSGTNPTTTLTFTHIGSSGAATVNLPALATTSVTTPSLTIGGATAITSTSSANSQAVTCPTGGTGTQVCDASGAWITAGGSMVYPADGIANSTGSAWGTSYSSTNPIPVSLGGTGTASPGLVAGSNVTISGTWPNQTITASSTGATAFSALTGATNTQAAMVVGSGASLATSGTGTIAATSAPYSGLTGTPPTWNQNTTGTAANITATSNSTLTSLPNLSLPYSQLTGTPATGVSSVFGRTGAVTAATGDYSVSQVTGAAPLASPTFTGIVTTPSLTNTGIASGAIVAGGGSSPQAAATSAQIASALSATPSPVSVSTLNAVKSITASSPVCDIRAFGAVIDNATDIGPYIQDCINQIYPFTGGVTWTILLPCGATACYWDNPSALTFPHGGPFRFELQGYLRVGSTLVASGLEDWYGSGPPGEGIQFQAGTPALITGPAVYGTVGTAITTTDAVTTITPTFTSGNIAHLPPGAAITIGETSTATASATRVTYNGYGLVTLTLSSSPRFLPMETLNVSGCSDSSFNICLLYTSPSPRD